MDYQGVLCKKWKIPEGDQGKFDINPGGQLQNISISSTGGGVQYFSVKHNEARGKNLKIQGRECDQIGVQEVNLKKNVILDFGGYNFCLEKPT